MHGPTAPTPAPSKTRASQQNPRLPAKPAPPSKTRASPAEFAPTVTQFARYADRAGELTNTQGELTGGVMRGWALEIAAKVKATTRKAKVNATTRKAKVNATTRKAKVNATTRKAKVNATTRKAKVNATTRKAKVNAITRKADGAVTSCR